MNTRDGDSMVLKRHRGRPPGSYHGGYRKVRLGADPEFELHKDGKPFPADKVFHGLHTALGVDGSASTGELRPCLKGGGRVDTMYYGGKGTGEGVAALIDQLARRLDDRFEVYGGSGCHRGLGGHLHASGISVDRLLLDLFDQFIAIPLNAVSDTRLRKSKGYGQLSDTRPQPWGFEYRSPCSWITTPALVKGVLSIAWLLMQSQKHGTLKRFRSWDDFYEYPREGHAKNIKRFTLFLSELKSIKKNLEEIEVLKAWGKRDLLKPAQSKDRPHPVEFCLDDDSLPEIVREVGSLFSSTPLRFVGARRSRTNRNVAFLPEAWNIDAPAIESVTFMRWSLDWVGLSWSLRQDVNIASQAVKSVVNALSRRRPRLRPGMGQL